MTVELHPWTRVLQSRYTTKAFDPHKRLDESQVASVMALLQWAPSSTNAQPWHFVIAGTPEGRQRVAGAMTGRYAFNQSKVLDASHVVVLASRQHLDEGYLHCLLQNEQAAGRFATDAARQGQHEGRGMFVDMHQKLRQDGPHWHEKQTYLALGFLLLGTAAMGIDACPMEGFDADTLNQTLGLSVQGLQASVVVPIGFRREDDFNARLPKSRWPAEKIFTLI